VKEDKKEEADLLISNELREEEIKEVNSLIGDELREELSRLPDKAQNVMSNVTDKISELVLGELLKPMFSEGLETSIPKETIKGAAIAGASISLLGGKSIAFSTIVAASAAYLSITPGKGGETMRFIGNTVWKSGNDAIDTIRQSKVDRILSSTLAKVGLRVGEIVKEKYNIDLPDLKLQEIELEERTQAKATVEKYLSNNLQQSLEETSRKVKEKKYHEDDDIADILSNSEDAILQAEAELIRLQNSETHDDEEEIANANVSGNVEEITFGESKKDEDLEEEDISEEDYNVIDDSAAVLMKEDLYEEDQETVQFLEVDQLEEEQRIDNDESLSIPLNPQFVEELQKYSDDDIAELSQEILAAQERDAVKLSESSGADETDIIDLIDDTFELEDEDLQQLDNEHNEIKDHGSLSDFGSDFIEELEEYSENDVTELSLEILAAQARDAVELFEASETVKESIDLVDTPELKDQDFKELSKDLKRLDDKDWSSLTVTDLKAELKSRGLKASGRKKADLITTLEESDLDLLKTQQTLVIQTEESRPTSLKLVSENDNSLSMNNIEKMTVSQLKDELRKRGLKVGGKKADLIKRIMSA
jgi:hypothetical protein